MDNGAFRTETAFPFRFCKRCVHQDVTVKQETLFGFDEIVARNSELTCSHAGVCKYVVKHMMQTPEAFGTDELYN